MEKRERAYQDYLSGMKYKDIADKYEVSLSAVKSWAARYWNNGKGNKKVATKKKKGRNQKERKLQPKPVGAPKGNKNAVGNNGGAPIGNTNALRHGGYSAVFWDTLTAEEQGLIECMTSDEETMLIEEIGLLSARERRLMQSINKYRDEKKSLTVASVVSSSKKRVFSKDAQGQAEKEIYNTLREQKINEGKISYLGDETMTTTTTEGSYNIVIRLERELTAVQSKKTRCIEALARLRAEKAKRAGDNYDNGSGTNVDVTEAEIVNIYLPDNGRD